MPLYDKKCTACAHRFTAASSMAASTSILCPQCGGATQTDWERQGVPAVPAHDLHGTRSRCVEVRAKPHEVQRLRRMFKKSGHCWKDDGRVVFNHRDDARKFFTEERDIKRRNEERHEEKAASAPAASPMDPA